MAEWISVKDKLPENGQRVIMCILGETYLGYSPVTTGRYWTCDTMRLWEPDGWNQCDGNLISHWMPMPDPPAEG